MSEVKEVSELEAMQQNMATMNGIIAEMKEIPVLPSEIPQDPQSLEKVEFPEEGGVLTYMSNQEHPYRGFPNAESVEKIDVMKKVSRAFLSGMYHETKGKYLRMLTLLPALWLLKPLFRTGVYVFYRVIERFRIKRTRYCTAVRELHRAFSITIDKAEKDTKLKRQLRDLICMVLEFDNAYRFRFQDIIVELDKQKLKKNPAKELNRLFTLMQSREKGQDVVDTWKLLKLALPLYLRVDKNIKNLVVDVLTELNMESVKLSVGDESYCRPRKDYNFGFMKQ